MMGLAEGYAEGSFVLWCVQCCSTGVMCHMVCYSQYWEKQPDSTELISSPVFTIQV